MFWVWGGPLNPPPPPMGLGSLQPTFLHVFWLFQFFSCQPNCSAFLQLRCFLFSQFVNINLFLSFFTSCFQILCQFLWMSIVSFFVEEFGSLQLTFLLVFWLFQFFPHGQICSPFLQLRFFLLVRTSMWSFYKAALLYLFGCVLFYGVGCYCSKS